MPLNRSASSRPRFGVYDVIALLKRDAVLMALVFLAVMIAAFGLVFAIGKIYSANSTLMPTGTQLFSNEVRSGDTQVLTLDVGAIAKGEAALLQSQAVRQRVVMAMGEESFVAYQPIKLTTNEANAVGILQRDLVISVAPDSPIITLSFNSRDARHSAQVVNTLIDQYLTYRRELLNTRALSIANVQKEAFEHELDVARKDGDQQKPLAALQAIYTALYAEKLAVETRLKQKSGEAEQGALWQRLSVLNTQLRAQEQALKLSERQPQSVQLDEAALTLSRIKLRKVAIHANDSIDAETASDVLVIDRARPDEKGRLPWLQVLGPAAFIGVLMSFLIGFILAFSRKPKITRALAERSFGVPVLAVAPEKSGR